MRKLSNEPLPDNQVDNENTTLIDEGKTITAADGNTFACQNGRVIGMGGVMNGKTITINGHTYKCK